MPSEPWPCGPELEDGGDENMVLARLDVARQAVAEATSIPELKELRDEAAAMEQYVKQRDYSLEIQNNVIELKLRAERRLGELIGETVRPGKNLLSHDATGAGLPQGVSRTQSHRYQQAASVPTIEFESHVEKVKSSGERLTTTGVARLAKEIDRKETRDENRRIVDSNPIEELAVVTQFSTIVIDPPWDWGDEGDIDQMGRAQPTYSTMSLESLKNLPVSQDATTNAHLYLWITNRSLPKGFELLETWGFRYVTCLTWIKPSFGMGNYYRGSTEHVLFGVKGSLPLLRKDVGTWFEAKRQGPHSTKPEEFYQLVQECSPGPWLEWFGRKQRAGWVVKGAESDL